jgi:uncharacterized protein (TIGR02391 family)
MTQLVELFPDPDVLCALEPYELGLRILPVLAAFKPYTPLYDASQLGLQSFLDLTLGRGPQPVGQYPIERKREVEEALREAWCWLESAGLLVSSPQYKDPVRQLSRKARQLAVESNPHRVISAHRLAKDALHPTIREDVWSLYHRDKYDTGVFEAMKAVEVIVREAIGAPGSSIGVNLMREAFRPAPKPDAAPEAKPAGKLTDLKADPGEQVARMELFAGSIGSYKNPQSHRRVALDDPEEVAEIIMLANHLLRIVDARKIGGPS